MVASCYRRRGDYGKAKRSYEQINRRHPENLECLKYLVQLCKDANLMEDANEWMRQMKKVENKLISNNNNNSDNDDGVSNNYGGDDDNNDANNNNKERGDNLFKGRQRQR